MGLVEHKLIALFALIALVSCAKQEADSVLWYDKPAENWLEALPVGNSFTGAMVFGGTDEECLQLNDGTFWSGGPHDNNSSQALENLPTVRELIFAGREDEAEKLIDETFISGPHGMRFLPLGNLRLSFDMEGDVTEYRRELNLGNALNVTDFTSGGVHFRRTVFASLADKVLVVRVESDNQLFCSVDFDSQLPFEVFHESDLVAVVHGVEHEGIESALTAECRARMIPGGPNAFTILVSTATNFVSYHDVSGSATVTNLQRLDAAASMTYEELLQRHCEAYSEQYDRVAIHLPDGPSADLPTNQRLAACRESSDPGMAQLMFDYGRYLLISSSQPGGQPANLQGLWNDAFMAPWDSKYTININTEMNYWPAEVCGLTECVEPLFGLIRDLSETGQITASQMYGCDGWMAHHNTDIWRVAGPVDGAFWGMYPNGGGWLSTHLWEHWLFTRDEDFLREWYPVLKGAAEFYLDYMQTDPRNGYLVVVPSVSPEHGPMGKSSPVCAGCTMDNQIARDVLTQARDAAEILGLDADWRDTVSEALAQLPPMMVGQYGQLQEWIEDGDDPNDEHRHISHLYGLYPSAQITPDGTPELFDAARVTLQQRGDMATGWSLGWKVNFWARMQDGNHALKILNNMFDGRTYPNLFDAHPPFQIDGNFGACAGIAEMLIQSHDGTIHILPALPDEWGSGSFRGLRARGGYVVDAKWKDGKVTSYKVRGGDGDKPQVTFGSSL